VKTSTPRLNKWIERSLYSLKNSTPIVKFGAFTITLLMVFSLTGVTASSLGLGSLRANPSIEDSNLLYGDPRYIRADEYARNTPWSMGIMADPAISFSSPLSADHTLISQTENKGPISQLVLFHSTILKLGPVLPDQQLFAFSYWLPLAIGMLGLFAWLILTGVRARIALVGITAILFAPSTTWWSFSPAVVVGWVAACAVLLEIAFNMLRQKRRVQALLAIAATSVLMVRLPFMYLPWTLPLALALGISTVSRCWLKSKRDLLVTFTAVMTGALFLLVVFIWENYAGWLALSETIYPGSRLVSGTSIDAARLLSAPIQWVLQNDPALPPYTNQSEVSSGYLMLVIVAFAFVIRLRSPLTSRLVTQHKSLVFIFTLLMSWVTITWPVGLATSIPILNRLPPDRALVVVFILSVIIFVIAANEFVDFESESKQLAAFLFPLIFLTTAWAGSQFKSLYVNDLRTLHIWLSAAAFAITISILVGRKFDRTSVLIASIYFLILGIGVNPLYQGLGDLRSSKPASIVKTIKLEIAPTDLVASDDFRVDALFMANAVPSLSGQQWVGPTKLWSEFAPGQEAAWNRGASYIVFEWSTGQFEPLVSNPSLDVIRISIDPCSEKVLALGMKFISSSKEMQLSCSEGKATKMYFGGNQYFIYRLNAS
jgi:hypothetical protein